MVWLRSSGIRRAAAAMASTKTSCGGIEHGEENNPNDQRASADKNQTLLRSPVGNGSPVAALRAK